MAMNRVQFQLGLSMAEFLERYGTEAQCRQALEAARWPEGFRCPCCAGDRCRRFERGAQLYLECTACGHQASLIAGTLFASTKLSLRTWFLAFHLLVLAKTNLSAMELMRQLGVAYSTAWRLKQKVMEAMTQAESERKLDICVQIDDAYLGGEHNGGKRGRGAEGKQAIVAAVETGMDDQRPRRMVIEPVQGFDKVSIAGWATRRLEPGCEVRCDGLGGFNAFADLGHPVTTMAATHRRRKQDAQGAKWVSVVLGNVKRGISGVYHALKVQKYARRYLGEACWRFNRRFNLKSMLPDLLRTVAKLKPHPEHALRKTHNFAY